jgi:uncharacterized protein (TIGR00297 family)
LKPLTRGGTVAALVIGVLTIAGASYGWTLLAVPLALAVLFGFFLSCVGMSSLGRARKRLLVDVPKGGPRDAWQVAANGGVATACAVASALVTGGGDAPPHVAYVLLWGFAGAYAAATADTWSTEIGSAFGGVPRSIAGFRRIAPGLSGGVTPLGSAAMVGGAAWIGLLWILPQPRALAFGIVTAAGIAGALLDSLLGATLQRVWYCPSCERTTETNVHICGVRAVPHRGLRWMTNDAVNALATLAGAVVAAALYTGLV